MTEPVLTAPGAHWPDPTPEMLASPEFEAVWQCIKEWDIAAPSAYGGYCRATGNHVRAILDALKRLDHPPPPVSRNFHSALEMLLRSRGIG